MVRTALYLSWVDADKYNNYSVFDIGSGVGYFAYLMKSLGNTVTLLDKVDCSGIFTDGRKALNLEADTVLHTIEPFVPLPGFANKISLAVSFSPHFYNPKGKFWDVAAWRFFLRDLAGKMTDAGKIVFHMNRVDAAPEFLGFGSKATQDLFVGLGARIQSCRVVFDSVLPVKQLDPAGGEEVKLCRNP
jgi:hypothetical protein